MAKIEHYKTADGNSIIPVADGDFFTDLMSADYTVAVQAFIEFYSDADATTKVTPSAGTVTVTGTPEDSDNPTYYTMDSGTFNAADAYLESRTKPNANDLIVKSKLTLSGVTGATHFRAFIWRY